MPTVKEITVYKFSELSATAQQKVIEDNYYQNVDYDWWDTTYDDAMEVGIKITGFDICRGRDISGDLIHCAEAVANLIIENHGEVCKTYQTAQSFLSTLLPVKVKQKLLEDNDEIYMECADEIEDMEETFKKDILNCYWKILYDEYDYLVSKEAIIESIESNDYDFEEDGTRY